MALEIKPLTPERWDDLVALFGPERGATGGCWCMYWRSEGSQKAFYELPREARRDAFAQRVAAGPPPGLIAYDDGVGVGWVSVGPRAEYPRFNRTKASVPEPGLDLLSTWAINCFFIRKSHRGSGLMKALVAAAVAFARDQGAASIDAAPLDVSRKLVAGEGYVGVASAFRDNGFDEVARHSQPRPLMRVQIAR